MSNMPVNTEVPKQKTQGMSRRWPLAFFFGAIVMFIVGGALVGVYLSNTSNCFNDSSSYDYYSNDDDFDCGSSHNGEYYGAVACFIIGGIFKLIGWVFAILYCVRRRRSHQQALASQYYTVPMNPQQPYNTPGPYGSQPQYPPQYPSQPGQPMYPDTGYHNQAPVEKESPPVHYV
ncbi:uncharacterized protein N7498_010405 [Penicillium cinerascens]|uniref:Transmembrane protein n=1 Tax=Penicillium cinerascens TaxID=70096 RepID=A0A9W9J6V3_9EURO|nr:uncharacterized protein N7498_010405 [Penicillium cinerascens]KAJ5191420.1 hypothetical protein N7498_010405 [Penicillium cinerascens]